MNWTLQSPGDHPLEFELVSSDGRKITFKYSRTQHSIRMRFNDNYGVFVIDEGSFAARKFAIRNVYGSEIGTVSKGSWRETSVSVSLNDLAEKVMYEIDKKELTINIATATSKKNEIISLKEKGDEHFMLVIIAFSWMQSVTALHSTGVF